MVRTMFSVMLGMLVAMMCIYGIELVGHWAFPMPEGQRAAGSDPADAFASAPLGMLACVMAGWLIAAFCGGWVSARLARVHRTGAAISVGVLIVLGVLLNAWMLPHPLWMTLLGVIGPVPLAWCGGRLALRRVVQRD